MTEHIDNGDDELDRIVNTQNVSYYDANRILGKDTLSHRPTPSEKLLPIPCR